MKHGNHFRPAHIDPTTHSLTTRKNLRSILVLLALLLGLALYPDTHTFAQSQIGLSLESTQPGQALDSASLSFTSEPQTYHFIQGSDSLQQWDYLPHATLGDGAHTQMQMHMSPTGSAYFYRIQSTDDPTQAPASLDFDNDGITNADELRTGAPYHFFQAESLDDTDQDGLPDYWETFYFGHLAQSATDDTDNDGIQLYDEYHYRLNPNHNDLSEINKSENYTYDFTRLMTAKNEASLNLQFSYDSAGNLLQVTN